MTKPIGLEELWFSLKRLQEDFEDFKKSIVPAIKSIDESLKTIDAYVKIKIQEKDLQEPPFISGSDPDNPPRL